MPLVLQEYDKGELKLNTKKKNIEIEDVESTLTTAEEIRKQLALSQKDKPEIVLVNFSTKYLVPGNALGLSKRKPGKSLDTFRESAKDLYKSQS